MKYILTFFLTIFISINLYGKETDTVEQKDFENKVVSVDLDGHKILKFTKSISKISFDTSEFIEANFLNDSDIPLSTLKIKGKKVGKQNAVVTFKDDSIITIKFNIVKNINDVIYLINTLYPNIKISQINESVVLQGHVKNKTERDSLLNIFEKYGIKKDEQIIDLIRDDYSTKMVRVKLYVVQIDNDESEQLINDWFFADSSGTLTSDTTFTANITSLTGGLTAVANRLGSNFDIGLTLNYLKKNNAIRIINESTLIMKEREESVFTAGGTFKVPTSNTANNGTTSSGYEDVEYGLNITVTINKIIEDNYVDFAAKAESTEIDWDNAVDNIPGLKGNTITTNVLVENGATIVLAGVIKNDNTQYKEKIPLLGDIPLVGQLFSSRQTYDDNTDLVFFITPEIIDPINYNQNKLLHEKIGKVRNKDYEKENVTSEKSVESKTIETKPESKVITTEPELTDEEKHQQRVNKILGY